MPADIPQPLRIASAQGDYPVDFFATVSDAIREVAGIPDAFYVIDRNVAGLYESHLQSLSDENVLLLDATEDVKSLDGVGKVVRWLQRRNCTKNGTVVAIGGGIIQDLSTFSSHIYYRGIRWAFVPTTLLSMSDSCIGAKCGINLGDYKNQLGVFRSPSRVLIATDFIDTLTDGDVVSGYGEILKLMLTGTEEGFSRMRRVVDFGGLRNAALPELIRESLSVKKTVIEEDEYELDRRRILNYGHTFGHALESLTGHAIAHGSAVAWGIDLANFISCSRGMLDRDMFEEVSDFVRRHFALRLPMALDAEGLIAASKRDKKAADGEVSLILMQRPGDLRIVRTRFDRELESQIADYLANHNAFHHA